MSTIHSITDLADQRLVPFRTMRAQVGHLNDGVFVAEGPKVVHRLLESGHEVLSVLLPPEWRAEFEPLLAARPGTIDLFVADLPVLEQLTGFVLYQGVLALARVPCAATPESLLALPRPRFFVALDGLGNADNTGTIVRSAVALGAQALVVGETASHPYMRRAVRSSMGAMFKLPYLLSADLAGTLAAMREAGIRCVAAHPRAGARRLWETDLVGDVCVVLGAEGPGLRPEIVAACDEAVTIPMEADVDSLNVASAAAVCFAEVQRQRAARRGP